MLPRIDTVIPFECALCHGCARNVRGTDTDARRTCEELHIALEFTLWDRRAKRLSAVDTQIGAVKGRLVRLIQTLIALRQNLPEYGRHTAFALALVRRFKCQPHIPIRERITRIEHLELLGGGVEFLIFD